MLSAVPILSQPVAPIPAAPPASAAWQPGAPPHITAETQAIDRQLCKRMKCPRCKRRGLEYNPLHLGASYRVQAVCASCGHPEEV